MKTGSQISAFVLGVSLALTQIAGCGGGGGGGDGGGLSVTYEWVEASTRPDLPSAYLVNPAVSWEIVKSGDVPREPLAYIDLAKLNNGQMPTVLEISSSGSFYYDEKNRTPPSGLAYVAAGLLVDAVNASGKSLAIGDGSSDKLTPVTIQASCGQTTTDSISEDFRIPNEGPAKLVLPPGAKFLQLSVVDCYFTDNLQNGDPTIQNSGDPIRVNVKVVQ